MHDIRRILVIANETVAAGALRDTLVAHAEHIEVLVVAPAHADDAPDDRLALALSTLDLAGVHVKGWVGAPDPLGAIADALTLFDADEILVVTHPEGRSAWIADDVVARACGRFGLPVVHLVAQPEPARLLRTTRALALV
jgi:hypothetical protein